MLDVHRNARQLTLKSGVSSLRAPGACIPHCALPVMALQPR